jgi:hypothetical protein
METKVWQIQGLRQHIFSYLRKKPHSACWTCGLVFQWDSLDKPRANSITCYGLTQCSTCFNDYEMEEDTFTLEYF